MRYIMGVDGGGSKTYTVITDENGCLLGKGVSGGGNYQGPGIDVALFHIKESIERALKTANLTYDDISFVQYGLAGADRKKDFSILEPALATLPFEQWALVCDTMEGLRTGSPENIGVVLVCGSGTNAAGRNKAGQMVQTGGFGYLFGDGRVGGFEMARETFRAAVRSWDLREIPSILQEKVARYYGFENMEQVYGYFLDHEIYEIRDGKLTLLLHEAAAEGDELAIRILKNTGYELGIAANSVIRKLGDFGDFSIPVVLVGSVVQKGKNQQLLQTLRETIEQKYKPIEMIIPEIAPVYGSVMLAMDRLGIQTPPDMYDLFKSYGGYDE